MRALPLLIAVVGLSGCIRLGFDDPKRDGSGIDIDAAGDLEDAAPARDRGATEGPADQGATEGPADQGKDAENDADTPADGAKSDVSGKLPVGAFCKTAGECDTGHCVDEVCCESACTGTCMACNAAWTGITSGKCAFVKVGKDPGLDCPADQACDGAGACKKESGTACILASECISASCVDGVCCDGACAGTCKSCSGLETGVESGICAYIAVNTDPDGECSPAEACDGAGACRLRDGEPCTGKTQCASGNCPPDDGVCCENGCGSLCKACLGAKTGAADGVCAAVLAGTDPDSECGALTCDGAGGCL